MFKNVVKEEIIIPAQMSYLKQVRDFIEHIGKRYRFTDKVVNSFKLVVDEACTNIVRHGYRDIKNGQIVIRAIIRRLSLTMVIIDHGKSYDPRQVKNPDLQKYVSIGKKGGLGIFMMRKLMDDIKYNVTQRGNELRLTKLREEETRSRPVTWWESLSMRNRYTIVTSVLMTVLALASYIIFNMNIEEKTKNEIFTNAAALSENLAQICWEPLNSDKEITLFENAKSIQQNNAGLVSMVFIKNVQGSIIACFPVKYDLIGQRIIGTNDSEVDTIGQSYVTQISFGADSNYYSFASLVKADEERAAAIGSVQLLVNENMLIYEIANSRWRLILILVGLLIIIGYVGSFVLITIIMDPFHKLAGWVRDVGQGTMDEDEIDIHADDELGEIAQAFNQMTNKFRDAQNNLMEQQRMQRELQVAQEIQQMLLPNDFPSVKGYDITSYYQAAKEVGGDLFDFVEVDEQTIGICVADVSGKGVPGSMVMTMIRTALRLESRGNQNPAEVLSKVNAFITDDIRKGMFVTAFYILLDSRERTISFASAGHNPMILYRGKSRETYYLNPPGFPVGITLPDINLFSNTIRSDKIRLHPDDVLVAYTDGITEAMNHSRELYGEERFLQSIRKHGQLNVVDFVNNVKEDIMNFTGGYEQNDDITLVAIKENMAAVDVKIEMFEDLFKLANQEDMTVAKACREMKVSSSTYYKYKKIYEEGGVELLREMFHGYTNIGLKHLSIEKKTKIYDVIRKHPNYGAKRISDEINTEAYAFEEISPRAVYEELRRAKLNRQKQRENFVKRGGKRRLKPPGTPLLTLDGEVMVGFRSDEAYKVETPFGIGVPTPQSTTMKEKIITHRSKGVETPESPKEPEVDENNSNGEASEILSGDDNKEQRQNTGAE